jgi:hypothetical protein
MRIERFFLNWRASKRGAGLLPRVPGHVPGLRVVQWRLPRGSLPTKEGRQGTVTNNNILFWNLIHVSLQKFISRKTFKRKSFFLLASWRLMTKIAGSVSRSGSRSTPKCHGSAILVEIATMRKNVRYWIFLTCHRFTEIRFQKFDFICTLFLYMNSRGIYDNNRGYCISFLSRLLPQNLQDIHTRVRRIFLNFI